ncbi:uncharacterized protein LOC120339807 [Styela clava]|uniref:uncharacterized protein LOC120339807 n=1 Tax=Styela clava TaxID=7725 RepID=UPI001939B156|nr:uncharacterized protein LOC120339807 [Styela clava]
MASATLPATSGSLPGSRSSTRSRHRRSATLPTRLPSIVPKSTLVAPKLHDIEPTKRIDVLHPPTVPRRTVFLETFDSHDHMRQRCQLMQRQQWYRYHGEWQKPLYGTPAVRESYRSDIRSVLKTQMEDRQTRRKRDWDNALYESIQATNRDRMEAEMDMEKRRNKMRHLNTFTRENKRIMEEKWQERTRLRTVENKKDLEQLQYNPINWSHTLK